MSTQYPVSHLESGKKRAEVLQRQAETLDDGQAKRHMDARLNARAARKSCESQTKLHVRAIRIRFLYLGTRYFVLIHLGSELI